MDIYNGVHYLVLILYDTWVVEMEQFFKQVSIKIKKSPLFYKYMQNKKVCIQDDLYQAPKKQR